MYLMFRCIQKTIYNPRGPEKINKLLFAFYSKRSPDKNTYHLGGTWWCGENRPVGRVSLYCQGAGTGRPWPGLYWYPLVLLWTPSPACNNKVLVSKGNSAYLCIVKALVLVDLGGGCTGTPWYCEIILFRGVFNYVEFVGKTIHEFTYPRYKIPSVRLSNLLVNNINIWYEPCILQVRNVI